MSKRTETNRELPGICVGLEALVGGDFDLFLLRYQTPTFIMNVIEREIERIMLDPYLRDIISLKLYRIGYFKLNFDRQILELSVTRYVGTALRINMLHPERENKIFKYMTKKYRQLLKHLFLKAFFEIIIRKGYKSFDEVISIDLYFNRSATQIIYHLDEDEQSGQLVNFFTLTYILPEGALIAGPSIVSRQNLAVRTSINVVLMNGTTIGIDNRIMLHSTPNMATLQREASGYGAEELHTDIARNPFHPPFTERRILKHRTDFVRQIFTQRNPDRRFVRIWYFDGELEHSVDEFVATINLFDIVGTIITEMADIRRNTIEIKRAEIMILGQPAVDSLLRHDLIQKHAIGGKKNEEKKCKNMDNDDLKKILENPHKNVMLYTEKIKDKRKNRSKSLSLRKSLRKSLKKSLKKSLSKSMRSRSKSITRSTSKNIYPEIYL